VTSGEPGSFGNIRLLRNHWSGPAGPRAYYWYLTLVEKLNASAPRAETTVKEAMLVLLERRHRSYAWQPVARIPLTGETLENPLPGRS